MTRILKALSIAGFSSVYLMQTACSVSGDGISILPTLPGITAITQLIQQLTGQATG
jgi:hypothetical protein